MKAKEDSAEQNSMAMRIYKYLKRSNIITRLVPISVGLLGLVITFWLPVAEAQIQLNASISIPVTDALSILEIRSEMASNGINTLYLELSILLLTVGSLSYIVGSVKKILVPTGTILHILSVVTVYLGYLNGGSGSSILSLQPTIFMYVFFVSTIGVGIFGLYEYTKY